jgi:TolB protein
VLIGALALALPALAGAAAAPTGRIAFVRFAVANGHPRIYTLAPGKKAAPRRLPLPGVATAAPAWSSTRRLAFVAGRNRPGSREISGNVDIYVSSADGRHARRLTPTASRVGSLAWSPDGGRLAFVKAAPVGNRSSIWTIGATGGAPRRVTRGAVDLEPSWAPDGQTIAFLRIDPNTYQGSIWTVRPNGAGLRRILTRMRNVGEPVWSPTGKRLLVHDSHALYSVTPDGHDRRTVVSLNVDPRGAVEDPQPSWSPDGNWIVFCQLRSKAPEGSDLWIVRADGTGLRRLTHSIGVDTDPAWSS